LNLSNRSDDLHTENNAEPDLSKYYPISDDIGEREYPEVNLKNIAFAMILLGLIAFMVNALMVYLFMRQGWVMRGFLTSAAEAGVILMSFGVVLYLLIRIWEHKFE
jgi:hypothetical protein